jgi:hypothetical protein
MKRQKNVKKRISEKKATKDPWQTEKVKIIFFNRSMASIFFGPNASLN